MIATALITAALMTGTGTAYHSCDGSTATTASGRTARVGYVANNSLPLGSWIEMVKPRTVMGRHWFQVMDRGGSSFALDFWAKDCAWMESWGRRNVSFRPVSSKSLYRGKPAKGWALRRSRGRWVFSWSPSGSVAASTSRNGEYFCPVPCSLISKVTDFPTQRDRPKNWRLWVRIGRCEQPGRGDWGIRWNTPSSWRYQGGLGIYAGTWDAYKPRGYPADAGQATWRQQMNVANRIAKAMGFSAWGCY